MLVGVVTAQPAEAQIVQDSADLVQDSADLSVQKFDFPPNQVNVGEPLFYELNIANSTDSSTANNAVVVDDLPSNTEFLFTISGDCTNAGGTVTCDLGDLAPGELTVVEFAVCPVAPGTATNTATASSDTPDPDNSNNTATETTEVVGPDVGGCTTQEPMPPMPGPMPPMPPMTGPMPLPTPEPAPPAQPVPPQPEEEPVADAGLCTPGAVAIKTQDFSLACAGGQAVGIRGGVPDGTLIGGEPVDEAPSDGRIAVAGDGEAFARQP